MIKAIMNYLTNRKSNRINTLMQSDFWKRVIGKFLSYPEFEEYDVYITWDNFGGDVGGYYLVVYVNEDNMYGVRLQNDLDDYDVYNEIEVLLDEIKIKILEAKEVIDVSKMRSA